MDLSIIIPAWREAEKIGHDIAAAHAFLHGQQMSGEVIVVDDASDDGTADAARTARAAWDSDQTQPGSTALRILQQPAHRGKGAAVRVGMLASQSELVMFADAGLCIPFDDALPGIEMIRSGACDIAHGSRRMPESVIVAPQSRRRQVLSSLFHAVALRLAGLPPSLTDTQCGFKIYRGDVARNLYARCRMDGFMFDLEVLHHARRMGLRVAEFPVHWSCDRDSRVRPVRAMLAGLSEVWQLRRQD